MENQTLAMLKALQGAFRTAFSGAHVMGALTTFLVAVSGTDLLNIVAPFWALVVGLVVSCILDPRTP